MEGERRDEGNVCPIEGRDESVLDSRAVADCNPDFLAACKDKLSDWILPCCVQSMSSSSEAGESARDFDLPREADTSVASFDCVRVRARFDASFVTEDSANSGMYALTPVGGLTGESSMKGSSPSSSPSARLGVSSSASLSCKVLCLPKGRTAWDAIRALFSLTGEGETGSPRRRFRALVTALFSAIG